MRFDIGIQILNLFDSILLIVEFGNRCSDANDIDILIVSDEFRDISKLKRKELIKRIDEYLDPICFTSKQFKVFKDSDCSLFNNIKNSHKTIYGEERYFF
jgi:predicted nucleotidyltransferase